jgi:hypothetical protein
VAWSPKEGHWPWTQGLWFGRVSKSGIIGKEEKPRNHWDTERASWVWWERSWL